MSPFPVCSVLDNPPEDVYEHDVEENLQNVVHVVASSDESDVDELPSENGYQLLPQDQSAEVNDNSLMGGNELNDEDNVNGEMPGSSIFNLLPQLQSANDETVMLWNETNAERSKPMDPDHAEKVKEAMAGFTLPPTAVPSWANVIPEEEWKAQLFEYIKGRDSVDKFFDRSEDR